MTPIDKTASQIVDLLAPASPLNRNLFEVKWANLTAMRSSASADLRDHISRNNAMNSFRAIMESFEITTQNSTKRRVRTL